MAYCELRLLGSPVQAPGVFSAIMRSYRTHIVMEYIPGKIVGKCLWGTKDQAEKQAIHRLVALGLSDLHRIPIATGPETSQNPTDRKISNDIFHFPLLVGWCDLPAKGIASDYSLRATRRLNSPRGSDPVGRTW